jgi:hypothetical protein
VNSPRRPRRPRRAWLGPRLDLLVLRKDQDDSIEAFELSGLDEGEIGGLRSHEAALAMLLSEDDVTAVASAMEPGSTAGVLVYENLWAIPFANACRRAGGQLVASGRIPIQAMLAAVEADELDDAEGDRNATRQTTHAPRRGARPPPVARTAATVGTAS